VKILHRAMAKMLQMHRLDDVEGEVSNVYESGVN
jgi:hypothetical protein